MDDNEELESFRRQWREEVAHKAKQNSNKSSHHTQTLKKSSSSPAPKVSPPYDHFPQTRHASSQRKDEDEESGPYSSGEIMDQISQLSLASADADGFDRKYPPNEPDSALEHFERAVQKEAEGNLGDSLSHYRKAYRLDSAVDKTYRNKHFAHSWKPPQALSADLSAATPQPEPQLQGDDAPVPTSVLIESFAGLPIPQVDAVIENTPPPPCPIRQIPSEVLLEILKWVALWDPASFSRLSLVCKRLAFHFAHEQQIWKRLCQGSEFGFKAMKYSFACDVHWYPTHTLDSPYTPFPEGVPLQVPTPLSSWSQVFQVFPRIRFTGIYISTVNYTRPGSEASHQNISWNTPIHIVTYFRYLRFYRDGSVISLLTTTEPTDVVPHISKENVLEARSMASSHRQHQRPISDTAGVAVSGAADPVPPAAMSALKHALRGRWRLALPTPPSDPMAGDKNVGFHLNWPSLSSDSLAVPSDPRDLVVETEGVDPKYIYTMHLSLRSSSMSSAKISHAHATPANPARNTRLVWKGFWSYNKLTDDWGEFGLRNDKSFMFRRVRGWDMS